VLPASVAPGDPAVLGELGQVVRPYLGNGRRDLRIARPLPLAWQDQVDWLVEHDLLPQPFLRRPLPGVNPVPRLPAVPRMPAMPGLRLMPEDQRHVHIAGLEHPHRLWRLSLGEPQVNAGVLGVQHGGRSRHDGAERGRERGQSQPPGPQARIRGELVLRGVQPPDNLPGALGEQPPGVGEPDAPAGLLDELGPGLRFKPREVMADGGLRVVQRVRGRGDRAMPRYRHKDAQPGDIQHLSTIGVVNRSG